MMDRQVVARLVPEELTLTCANCLNKYREYPVGKPLDSDAFSVVPRDSGWCLIYSTLKRAYLDHDLHPDTSTPPIAHMCKHFRDNGEIQEWIDRLGRD